MDAARPEGRGRRLTRNATGTSPHTRLVRVGLIVAAPAVLALLFAASTIGTLPRAPLEPLFDGEAAADLANTLSAEYPSRVPGTLEAEGAARWFHETMRTLGLKTEDDVWTESLPDLGRVVLRNVVTVVSGRSDETILVVAHRDNGGAARLSEDNAGGTAALVELAKGFARQDLEPDPQPQRTLVFVSTDGGVYGGAGAARFAETSPLAGQAIAALVLDGLGGAGRPRIAIAGDEPVSSARALVSTARARIEEETRTAVELPSLATQLADLATPFAEEEQGRLLASGIAAVGISSTGHRLAAGGGAAMRGTVSAARLETLGSAVESLIDSVDISVGAPFRTPDTIYFRDRALSGWSVRLTLVLLVVPFALALVDLLARVRRRRIALLPAVRCIRTRLFIWLFAALLVGVGAATDVFPTGAALPLPPFSRYVTDPNVAGLGVLGVAFAIGWLGGRRRLVPVREVSPEDRTAGLAVALALLGVVAIVLAVVKPYALVFVLPSLYAWIYIEPAASAWRRVTLFAVGLTGPLVGLALIAGELGLTTTETPLYAIGLVTVGYVSIGTALLAIAWAAAAAQVGAVALGRYGPYAGGDEPPPPGVVRLTVARIARRYRPQSSGR